MWYSVNVLLRSESLWQESVVLFEASTEDDVRRLSEEYGRRQECEYIAGNGRRIHWRFAAIQSIHQLESEHITTGVEIFSRFLRQSEAESLLQPFDD